MSCTTLFVTPPQSQEAASVRQVAKATFKELGVLGGSAQDRRFKYPGHISRFSTQHRCIPVETA